MMPTQKNVIKDMYFQQLNEQITQASIQFYPLLFIMKKNNFLNDDDINHLYYLFMHQQFKRGFIHQIIDTVNKAEELCICKEKVVEYISLEIPYFIKACRENDNFPCHYSFAVKFMKELILKDFYFSDDLFIHSFYNESERNDFNEIRKLNQKHILNKKLLKKELKTLQKI